MKRELNLKNAYDDAYRLGCQKLMEAGTEDYPIHFFGKECCVVCKEGSVTFESAEQLGTTEKIIILHYLAGPRNAPLTGKLISFKEVPGGGAIYYDTFKLRSIDPLVDVFSKDPDGMTEAAKQLGGSPGTVGDASVVLYALPQIPVTYVVWLGDDEIEPNGTILFDSSIETFLPVEDIVVAASYGSLKLIRAWKDKKGLC